MDIRVLQYFLIIAREKSISRAAEVLHMTQPPLSRQLKELENELGKHGQDIRSIRPMGKVQLLSRKKHQPR